MLTRLLYCFFIGAEATAGAGAGVVAVVEAEGIWGGAGEGVGGASVLDAGVSILSRGPGDGRRVKCKSLVL